MNQIICGDNVEVLSHFPSDFVDLTVTSPPYDNIRNYKKGNVFNVEGLVRKLYRVTKPGGVVVWVVGDQTENGSETLTSFCQAIEFREMGFNLHDTMIYKKIHIHYPSNARYHQMFEYMFVFSKGKPKTFNPILDRKNKYYGYKKRSQERIGDDEHTEWGDRIIRTEKYGMRFNVWEYDNGYMKTTKDVFAYEHPALFPEQLAEDHIISWSNPGDVILDPFCGGGTALKMAKLLNRQYVGIDISEKYCEISRQRVNVVSEQYISTNSNVVRRKTKRLMEL